MEKNKKKNNIWLFIISIVLLVVGVVGLLLNNKNIQANIINNMQTSILRRTTPTTIDKAQQSSANFQANTTKEANTKTVLTNKIRNKDASAIGFMSIPQVGMKNPIFNGYGENGDYLALGACTMKPNQVMGSGNYALAGHYMAGNTVFHSLNKVTKGMKIYLTNLNNIFVYKVNNVTTVTKYDVNIINNIPNQSIITLITCTQLNETPYRTVVQGNLIDKLPVTNSNLNKLSLN